MRGPLERVRLVPAPNTVRTDDRAVARPAAWVRARQVCIAATERQRRHRQREREGRIVLRLDPHDRVIEALLATGAITEAESLSRSDIEAALTEMLDEWSQRAISVTA